jgi:hypothetical protein
MRDTGVATPVTSIHGIPIQAAGRLWLALADIYAEGLPWQSLLVLTRFPLCGSIPLA